VAGHFVLSMVLVADAVILLWRSGQEPGPRAPVVDHTDLVISRLAVAGACLLMVTGPLVTGTGPHAGDVDAKRFPYFIPDVARIHSINMWVFLVLVVVVLVRLRRRGAPAAVQQRGYRLLVVIVAQGAIGYTQYELGIPAWLVAFHIAGATAVMALTVWFHLGLSAPVAAVRPRSGAGSGEAVTDAVGTPA
jgi:heme a synthase